MNLKDFFVKLLEDENLARYYERREEYIAEHEGLLADDDLRLLRNGRLAEIEARILEQEAASGKYPILIVTPIVTPVSGPLIVTPIEPPAP